MQIPPISSSYVQFPEGSNDKDVQLVKQYKELWDDWYNACNKDPNSLIKDISSKDLHNDIVLSKKLLQFIQKHEDELEKIANHFPKSQAAPPVPFNQSFSSVKNSLKNLIDLFKNPSLDPNLTILSALSSSSEFVNDIFEWIAYVNPTSEK